MDRLGLFLASLHHLEALLHHDCVVKPEILIAVGITSAVVAALVALAIEWLAKPGLEARKELILERHRAIRGGQKALREILECAVRISNRPLGASGMLPEDAKTYSSFFAEFDKRLLSALDAFDSSFTEIAPDLESDVYSVITSYLGVANGEMKVQRRTAAERAHLVAFITLPMLELWKSPVGFASKLIRQKRVKTLRAVIADRSTILTKDPS